MCEYRRNHISLDIMISKKANEKIVDEKWTSPWQPCRATVIFEMMYMYINQYYLSCNNRKNVSIFKYINLPKLRRVYVVYLTLALLEPKFTTNCHCHQQRARPVCTSMQSFEALFCWLVNFTFSRIPKSDNGQF